MNPQLTDAARDIARPPVQAYPETRAADRVSFREKLGLGIGSMPVFYGNCAVKSLLLPVYQMQRALNPTLLGLVVALPHCWDAITDPLIGTISDNCRTRFGRRRPIIVAGAVLQAFAFCAIWLAPSHMTPDRTLLYLAATLLVFYTCFSIFTVPLGSLTCEMTPDYRERTRVTAFGGFFAKVAELSYGWMYWVASLAVFGSVTVGLRIVGCGIGILIMGVCGVIPGILVRERYSGMARRQPKVRLASALPELFKNRAFAVIAGLMACQVIAGTLVSNLDYYLLVYYMNGGNIAEGTKWKAILGTGYAVVGLLSIYPVNWLANRIGKRAALVAFFLLLAVGSAAKWVIFTPGNSWKMLLDPVLCGPIYPALLILIPSMIADVCDDDEWRHGLRREGTLSACCSWIQKAGYSLSFLGAGIALNFVGFDASLGGGQSGHAILSMRWLLAGATACWALIALALLRVYPLDQQRACEIRSELEIRRGAVV